MQAKGVEPSPESQLEGEGFQHTNTRIIKLNKSPVFLNGNLKNMTAYNINGNNYFKLRDIGMALNFDVSWDSNLKGVVIDTTKGYDANT